MNRQSGRARAVPYYNPRHTAQVSRYHVPVQPPSQGVSVSVADAVPRHHGRVQHAPHHHQQDPGSCNICSFAQHPPDRKVPIYHRHFSSLRVRCLNGSEASNSPYLCPSCRSSHVPYPKTRTKLIISDSTLHMFFAPPDEDIIKYNKWYKGDILHCDYLTIPGASIHTLTNAFKIEYLDTAHARPMDVCIVAGYNDLVRNYDREYIMYKFKKLAAMVLDAKVPNVENTVTISTLMYAPQLAWFPDNGPAPYPGYSNQREKIDWLNSAINQENRRNNVPEFPGFHTYGVRKATRKYTDGYGQVHQRVVKAHRWEHWRESEPASMLHLRNDRRIKMAMALNKYLIFNTDCS